MKGRHQLHIKVEGQHVRGSPSSVAVVEILGTPIPTLRMWGEGTLWSGNREVVVTEWSRHCVSALKPQSFDNVGAV